MHQGNQKPVRLFTVLLFIVVILFSSCLGNHNCKKFYLGDREKQWLDIYNSDSVFVFKSLSGKYDTFLVTDRYDQMSNPDCNWFELGTEQRQSMGVSLLAKNCSSKLAVPLPDTGRYSVGIMLQMEDSVGENLPSFAVMGQYPGYYISDTPVTLQGSGKQYDSVAIITVSFSPYIVADQDIHVLYWERNRGLIKYEKWNNEVFELYTR